MATDLWTYRTGMTSMTTSDELEGFEVEATDGDIGKIDEATDDVGASYVVVDTGPWIFGRKVVLPAGVIERVDLENRKVRIRLTKDQIKNSPEYNGEEYREPTYRTRLGEYYDPYL
jgi:PRC-barrel domain protein